MASLERQQIVLDLLKSLRGADSLKRLFSELNYNYVNKPLSKRQLSEASQTQVAGDPTLLATAGKDGVVRSDRKTTSFRAKSGREPNLTVEAAQPATHGAAVLGVRGSSVVGKSRSVSEAFSAMVRRVVIEPTHANPVAI